MANKVFRLSISPEDLPEVRRVIDFDGRNSLADVHDEIAAELALDDSDHLYGFFLSGRVWDAKSAYLDPRTDGQRADKALLFRLGLAAGKTFAYLFDFGAERRFVITVVEVRDVAQPLAGPELIEAVGEPPENAEPGPAMLEHAPAEVADLVPLAEAYLDAEDGLEDFADELNEARAAAYPWELEPESADEPRNSGAAVDLSHVVPAMRSAAAEAIQLLHALAGSVARFLALDEWLLERAFGTRLLDLPTSVALVGEFDLALELARALVFADRELMQGDVAIILARAGRRAEALAQLDANLAHAEDAALVELKAGDTHAALRDLPAAEAYYQRSLDLADAPVARYDARIRLVNCLIASGRTAEARQALQAAHRAAGEVIADAQLPVVGRNDPCPCGSGKKYKKCHGANT